MLLTFGSTHDHCGQTGKLLQQHEQVKLQRSKVHTPTMSGVATNQCGDMANRKLQEKLKRFVLVDRRK